jgi:hypothetical protein
MLSALGNIVSAALDFNKVRLLNPRAGGAA